MTYADDEKVRLLRILLPTLTVDEQVAAELPFHDVRRKADLAVVSPTRLSAFEIKGQRDNLGSLVDQIGDYQMMFLDVTVALAPKHLAVARSVLPRTVGLIELGESVRWLRAPRTLKRLPKTASLAWLHSQDLRRLARQSPVKAGDVVAMRSSITALHSEAYLSRAALEAIVQRNSSRWERFLEERSHFIDHDDVMMLTLPRRIR